MPITGFWTDTAVVDRIIQQNNSFALSNLQGFPARRVPLNWFINRPGKRELPNLRGESWIAA
jgi:hypothetical protein